MKTFYSTILLVTCASAFPQFRDPENIKRLNQVFERSPAPNRSPYTKRAVNETLANLVDGLLSGKIPGATLPPITIPGLPLPVIIELPGLVTAGRKEIPDSAHPFKAPGAGDQRGGCPGLNMMANYGYVPRNGIVSVTELLYGMEEMFAFAPDLSAALVGFTFFGAIDLTSLKFSIGDTDSRTNGPLSGILGTPPGLFSKLGHNSYENDGSIGFADAYFENGDTKTFSSDFWSLSEGIANKTSGGNFDQNAINEIRYQHYRRCIETNPQCYWGPKQALFYVADTFTIVTFPSSDESGTPRAPTLEVTRTFEGVVQNSDGTFSQVPSKLPPGPEGEWYRRSTPLTVAEFAQRGVDALAAHPPIFGGNNGKVNSFVPIPSQLPSALTSQSVMCFLFNAFQDEVPDQLQKVKAGLIELTDMLFAPARLHLGC